MHLIIIQRIWMSENNFKTKSHFLKKPFNGEKMEKLIPISSQSFFQVNINNFWIGKREIGLNFLSIKSTSIHFFTL